MKNALKIGATLALLVIVIAVIGCGGNGGTTETSSPAKYDGDNWELYSFQFHDDGSAKSIEIYNLTIANGQATGNYEVWSWPFTGDPEKLDYGQFHLQIHDNPEIGVDTLSMTFNSECGRGGGGGQFLDVGLYKARGFVMSTPAFSNVSENEYRPDWIFTMYQYEDYGTQTPRTPKRPDRKATRPTLRN